jgi:hypothetical protein
VTDLLVELTVATRSPPVALRQPRPTLPAHFSQQADDERLAGIATRYLP